MKMTAAQQNRFERFKKRMLGSAEKRGLLSAIVVYVLLIVISFIFVYPVLYMLSRSLMSRTDLLDSSAMWIPGTPTLYNYSSAIRTMDYWTSLLKILYLLLNEFGGGIWVILQLYGDVQPWECF